MTITNFLKEHQLSDIAALDTQKLVEVEDSSSVGEAFHALVSHSLHCVPVKSGEKYVGLLDIKDFVTYLIRLCKGGEVYDEAGKLSDLSHQNPFRSLPAHGTVLDAFQLFAKHANEKPYSLQRIPLIGPDGKVCKMLSQSTLVEWFYKQEAKCSSFFSQSVLDLHCGAQSGLRVKASDKLRDAFEKIISHNFHGCPVENEVGDIVGNLSLTDVQFSVQKNLKYFEERTVQEFLTDFNIASAPIYCEEGASVLDAMKLLVEHKVHRIYVAKKEGKVGVVTFTDIIDTILIGSFTEILSAMPVG